MVADIKEIAVNFGQEREVESLMEESVKMCDKETLLRDDRGYFLSGWIGDEKKPDERITLEEARNWMRGDSVTAIDIEESKALGWASSGTK